MVQRSLRKTGRWRWFSLCFFVLAGLLLARAKSGAQPGDVKKFISITPTPAGVVLKGTFDARAKKAFQANYPSTGHVEIKVAGNGASGNANPSLRVKQDDTFSLEILTDDLPSIDASQLVEFRLTFPGIDEVTFVDHKAFLEHIGQAPGVPTKSFSVQADSKNPEQSGGAGADQAGNQHVTQNDVDETHEGEVKSFDPSSSLYVWTVPLKLVVEICAVVTLVLCCLVVWQIVRGEMHRRRSIKRSNEPKLNDAALLPSPLSSEGEALERLSGRVEVLERSAKYCNQEIAGIRSLVDGVNDQLKSLENQQVAHQEATQSVYRQEIQKQLGLILSALETAGVGTGASMQTSLRTAANVPNAVAAVVNEWLANGRQDRRRLHELAAEAGLGGSLLAEYRDSAPMPSGAEAEYTFSESSDGSWLWARVAGSEDFWAAPADSRFMTMGYAPAMLNRLFEGMRNAEQKFRFETIYKPCRLRPVAGKSERYTLVERGLLQLEGAPAPAESVPSRQRIMGVSQASLVRDGGDLQVGAPLGSWIKWVAEQLKYQRSGLDEIARKIQAVPTPSIPPAYAEQMESLLEDVRGLKAELTHHAASIKTQVAPSPRPVAVVLESVATPQHAAELPPPPQVASKGQQKTGKTTQTQPAAKTQQQPPAEVAVTIETNPVPVAVADLDERESLPPTLEELRRNEAAALPEVWREAFLHAAALPESVPDEVGVPSGEVYLQRVRVYRDELEAVDQTVQFTIVHIQRAETPNQNLISLHNASEKSGESSGDVASISTKSLAWQFAIRAGQPGGDVFYLLFPSCMLDKSKYASMYSVLIEDLPEVSFSTDAMDGPAVLKLDAPGGLYTILKKTRLLLGGGLDHKGRS